MTVKVQDVAETVSGKVIDGHVAGATIFQDLDNDNVLDPGEPKHQDDIDRQLLFVRCYCISKCAY